MPRTVSNVKKCTTISYRKKGTCKKRPYKKYSKYAKYQTGKKSYYANKKARLKKMFFDREVQVVEEVRYLTPYDLSASDDLIDGTKWPHSSSATGNANDKIFYGTYLPFSFPYQASQSPDSSYGSIDHDNLIKYQYIRLVKTEFIFERLPGIETSTAYNNMSHQVTATPPYKGFLLSDLTQRYHITETPATVARADVPDHPRKYRLDSKSRHVFTYNWRREASDVYNRWYDTNDVIAGTTDAILLKTQTHFYKIHSCPWSSLIDNPSALFRIHIKRTFEFARRKDAVVNKAFGNIALMNIQDPPSKDEMNSILVPQIGSLIKDMAYSAGASAATLIATYGREALMNMIQSMLTK